MLPAGDVDIELAPGAPALEPLIAPPGAVEFDMSGGAMVDVPGVLGAVDMLPPPAVLPVVVPAADWAKAEPGASTSAVAIKSLRIFTLLGRGQISPKAPERVAMRGCSDDASLTVHCCERWTG